MSTGLLGLLINAQSSPPPPQFHWWQGASGYWWITTVYPLFGVPDFDSAVYIFVRRNADGACDPVYVGQTSDTHRRMSEHLRDKLVYAMILGANEIHVHLLAETKADRFAVETDLRNRHLTPLNKQGVGLFGLASLYG